MISGKSQNSRFPKETKNYVPKLMAALIISRDPAKYGFVGINYHEPVPFETIRVAPQKKLSDIAKIIGVSKAQLIELNPALIHDATPSRKPLPYTCASRLRLNNNSKKSTNSFT